MAVDRNEKWVDKVPFVEFAINSSVAVSMGKTPFELSYGEYVRTVADQLDGMHRVEVAQSFVDHVS